MTKQVEKKFKLRPRARIIQTFGEELISSDYVAIVELIKNSYDADASRVKIAIEIPTENNSGKIIIRDDGIGMSSGEVEEFWMEPASTNKYNKKNSKGGRRYLGQKGIGRFSAAKLAKKMKLVSLKKGCLEVEVEFDWRQYYNPEKYLDEIEGKLYVRKPERIKRSGTIIEMTELCSKWDKEKVEELIIQLQRLISPVAPKKHFQIHITFSEPFTSYSDQIKIPKIFQNPHYSIEASLTDEKTLHLSYTSSRSPDTNQKFEINSQKLQTVLGKVPTCGSADFKFKAWDRGNDDLKELAGKMKISLQNTKRDLNKASGISIYRDDFRVTPYGDYRNDWLRLDLRRVQAPSLRLSNNQIVGRISITDKNNSLLKDQTNREGIIETGALDDLRQVAILVLAELETRRFKERRLEQTKKQTGLFLMQQKISLSPIREAINKKLPDDTNLQKLVNQHEQKIGQRVDELRNVVIRYRRLSSLGRLTDIVLHEARNGLSRINKGLYIIEGEFKSLTLLPHAITRNMEKIKRGAQLIANILKKLEPFGGRQRERAKNVNLAGAIKDVFVLYESELDKLSIKYNIPETEHILKISESDLKLVFVNLLENSLYWLRAANTTNKIIDIKMNSNKDGLEIIFSDNGLGVSSEDAPYIFDPYFSKKPEGVGLGLTIAAEIVEECGGKLEFMNLAAGATFKIVFKYRRG